MLPAVLSPDYEIVITRFMPRARHLKIWHIYRFLMEHFDLVSLINV